MAESIRKNGENMNSIKTTIILILIAALTLPTFASSSGIEQDSLTDYYYSLNEGEIPVLSDISKPQLNLNGKGMVLMEASTGTVLYEENKDGKLPPASVTKVMTMLLVIEAIDSGRIKLEDVVSASEHAVSMGGTQIYLELGEEMTVHELLKAVAVPSANDAAVALAEYIAGSEAEFVNQMNQKAAELGMLNTHFTNCTGLFDDENHYTTAYDLALATKELLTHPKILEYTTIWMDSLRNGEFGLANTNKLLRTYSGMNGMKTGYTKLAGHCLSGTAIRNGVQLIAVVLGSSSSQERFDAVSCMLDYGFANFSVLNETPDIPQTIQIKKGKTDEVKILVKDNLNLVVVKGKEKKLETIVEMCEYVEAPAKKGQTIGSITYKLDDEIIKVIPIFIDEDSDKATLFDYFKDILSEILI